jgi:hypothetical protein
MLENLVQAARGLDHRVLDELNTVECEQARSLRTFLQSLETLALNWEMLNGQKYLHRLTNYGDLDILINELPRSIHSGKLFCSKTFVLSCKTPYMNIKDGSKVFINKEYSSSAGKLHLSYYTLFSTISNELTTKIDEINRTTETQLNSSRVSLLAFFKTMFSSDNHSLHEAQMHPLFREAERPFLKKLRKQIKLFELCFRNFETTYIAMIKDLQEQTFKRNIECKNPERSIIMKRGEKAHN